MRNVLKYSKIIQNGSVRWRFGCGYFFNLLMFSTVNMYQEIVHSITYQFLTRPEQNTSTDT